MTLAVLCACHSGASTPAPAPQAAAAGSACLIRDDAPAVRDTFYVVDEQMPYRGSGARFVDCAGHSLPAAPEPTLLALNPAPGTDLRDVLDRGLPDAGLPKPDVMVTRDPDVIAYATRSGGYLVAPMPWNTTWVLVTVDADSEPPVPSESERDALAHDAVRADARGALGPFAWRTEAQCTMSAEQPVDSPARFVAYADNDAIARQLAERIVSLAAAGGPAWIPAALRDGSTPRVIAIRGESAIDALAAGRAAAAVVMIRRDPDDRCGVRGGGPVQRHTVPLVDVRAHVIVRRGSGATFVIAADGSLHFVQRAP